MTNFSKNTSEEEIVYLSTLINNYHDSFKVEKDIDLNDYLKIEFIHPKFAEDLKEGFFMY